MLRKKMKKSVVVALTMGMVLSQGSVYLAATGPNIIPYETSKHKIHVGYINAEPVSILQMRLDYTEYDAKKTTTRNDSYTNTRTGGCTSIEVLKENGGDISFTKAAVSVKVDSRWVIDKATIVIE